MYHDTSLPAVWGRSSPSISESYVIFCVGQDPVKIAAFRAWATDRQLGFKSLKGCYKGQMEESFITNLKNLPYIQKWLLEEESILLLGPANARDVRPAELVYANGKTEELGKFFSVGPETAKRYQSWTYDPLTDNYFITQA